jgi:hypothetical protein
MNITYIHNMTTLTIHTTQDLRPSFGADLLHHGLIEHAAIHNHWEQVNLTLRRSLRLLEVY